VSSRSKGPVAAVERLIGADRVLSAPLATDVRIRLRGVCAVYDVAADVLFSAHLTKPHGVSTGGDR